MQSLVARFSVREVSEAPAACRRIFLRVLDHELNIQGRSDNDRLSAGELTGQSFVVVFRQDTRPMNRGNDTAVREGKLSFFNGIECYIVAELSPQLVALARNLQLVQCDHFPIAV